MNSVLDEAQVGGQIIEFVRVQAPRLARAFAAAHVQRPDVPASGRSISELERTL